MDIEIIKCGRGDLDALAEFYDKVTAYLEATVNYPLWTRGEYPAEKSISRAISMGTQYKCTAGGKVVGAFVLNDDPEGDYSAGEWRVQLADGEYMVVHALAVDPDMYGNGIAGRMVRFSLDTAKERGYKALRLDVVPTNTPARALYEKEGFTFAGEKDLGRGYDYIPTFVLYEMNF